ncbi:uncharacterized protein LOC116302290 [Actinia tenebrosa]|uniref:Uncharacterized protein LOC116302290 n=1 Tax=Actinia tenebrosa TaxID=6105 RepID=A0A6P8IKV2_ACTTE|nr:uncharacterized protein LOC116302290 [Actinia tenebrosa]
MKKICKQVFGLLQLFFIIQLAFTFIMFVAMLIHKDELTKKDTSKEEQLFLKITMIACCSLVPTTFLIVYLIVHKAHTFDMVGNFRILQVGPSFKVAMLSWIINVIVVILNVIAIAHCKDASGYAPWELTLVYYSMYIIQQSCQIKCLYKLEVRSMIIREGPDWHRFRRAMFILMALFNALSWLISLSDVDSVSDLNKNCMDGLLTASVFRIVHTVDRAAILAFRIESTLLFLKFFHQDRQSLEGLTRSELVVTPTTISHSEIGKGRWSSGFLAACYCGIAIASFVLSPRGKNKHQRLATAACLLTSLTLAIVCVRLKCSGSSNRIPCEPNDNQVPDSKGFENVSVYISGEKFHHTKLLLFYSIVAVTYHTVLALHLTTVTPHTKESYYQIARESFKAFGCISLGMFGMWMCHKRRRIRSWRSLHVMLWMIATMFFLDMAEECANYGIGDEFIWVTYVFPLAIDFKMYLFIHTWSDLMVAKNEYLVECENLLRNRRDGGQSEGSSIFTTVGLGPGTPLLGGQQGLDLYGMRRDTEV